MDSLTIDNEVVRAMFEKERQHFLLRSLADFRAIGEVRFVTPVQPKVVLTSPRSLAAPPGTAEHASTSPESRALVPTLR